MEAMIRVHKNYQRELGIYSQKSQGFTLVEIIMCLLILGILAAIVTPRYSAPDANSLVDESILKTSIRQTIIRAMSDVENANWNIHVVNKSVQVRDDQTVISNYALQTYNGSFDIAFNNLGQPQSTPSLPYGITIDQETGFVP